MRELHPVLTGAGGGAESSDGLLEISEGAFFLARPKSGGGEEAVARRADTGIGVEVGQDVLHGPFLGCE